MIPSNEMRAMAELLLQRSREGRVAWQAGSTDSPWDSCVVQVGDTEIGVRSVFGEFSGSGFELYVSDNAGHVVGMLSIDTKEQPGDPTLQVLKDLHEEASRAVTGWDKTLDRLKAKLNSGELIGG